MKFLKYLCNMNQFPTLIEYLLLSHDYVVIPGLGTFIVQQKDARRNEEEEAFLPPYRSVRFNTELTQNDNLLLEAMGEIYNISQTQADQMLATWINDFRQTLEDNGCVEFGAIGIFTQEDGRTLQFDSLLAGVTTPDYYGLDAFHFCEIEPLKKTKTAPRTASMEADEKAIIIRINRRIANWTVAACAAILLFMVFNLPTPESAIMEQRSSALEWFIRNTKNTDTDTPTVESTVEEAVSKTVAKEEPKAEVKAEPAIETPTEVTSEKEYCIVMASAIPQANAERYVVRLQENGFVSARIVTTGKMLRVVVGHYPTEQEAANAAHEIHQRSREYRSAWVHCLN